MERFFDMLGKERKKVAYGLESVEKALKMAAVDTLFLSKKLDKKLSAELKKKAEDISANVEYVSVDYKKTVEALYNYIKSIVKKPDA